FGAGKLDLPSLKLAELQLARALKQQERRPAVALSRDGKLAALEVAPGGVVQLLDTATGSVVTSITLDKEADAAVLAFSPDGKHLALISGAGVLRLWDIAAGKFVRT